MKNSSVALALLFFCFSVSCCAQQIQELPSSNFPTSNIGKISDRTLDVLNQRYSLLSKLVERRAEKAIQKMIKKESALEQKLQGQVHGPDSIRASALFAGNKAQLQQLLTNLRAGPSVNLPGTSSLRQYMPRIDSMQTALKFLGQPGLALTSQTQKIRLLSQHFQQLQESLRRAGDVQAWFSQCGQQLQSQLSNTGMGKQLLGVNQEAYYYQAQLLEYKGMLNDPEKMQQAVLSAVREIPAFQSFFQKNSYWSVLFPAQPNAGTPAALAGLQTRDDLQKQLQTKLNLSPGVISTVAVKAGESGEGGTVNLQNQLQNAQAKLESLKEKLASVGGSSGGNITMPDFQPNPQHNKTFLKRLEYSFTIQNSSSTALLPAISSLGLNIGYKLNSNAIVGVGGSYLLGVGNGLNQIHFSNQGLGYRVFSDIRLKGV